MTPFEFSPLDPDAQPRTDGRLDLSCVDGAAVPTGILEVELGPRRIGGGYLRVFVREDGARTRFVDALFNDGPYPGQNWIEIVDLELPPGIDAGTGWEARLVPLLAPMAAAIPRGGHMMIEYEKTMWKETQLGLLAGIPPLATPMGALLHRAGCGDSFKDWYFPEGGQEGGRKLQGNKAFDDRQAVEMAGRRSKELERFLAGAPSGLPIDARARETAGDVLAEIQAKLS